MQRTSYDIAFIWQSTLAALLLLIGHSTSDAASTMPSLSDWKLNAASDEPKPLPKRDSKCALTAHPDSASDL